MGEGYSGEAPGFLRDGQKLLYVKDEVMFICDRDGKNNKKILSIAPDTFGTRPPLLSPDGSSIYFTKTMMEPDIWMIELE